MNPSLLLERITLNPNLLAGRPTVRGLPVGVEQILSALAEGATPEDVLGRYPQLERDDIRASIAYVLCRLTAEPTHRLNGKHVNGTPPPPQPPPADFWLNEQFFANRERISVERYRPFSGKYIAWTTDGSDILDSDGDPMELDRRLSDGGHDMSRILVDFVDWI
jgi:uncharacterized protein (DUF433 family)